MQACRIPILLLLLVSGLLAIASSASCDDSQAGNSVASRSLKLPKIFDFYSYISMYGKKYVRPIEWLNRARLFFASAYQVFIQSIKYMHRLSSKYYAINRMSDWTKKERLATLSFRPRNDTDSVKVPRRHESVANGNSGLADLLKEIDERKIMQKSPRGQRTKRSSEWVPKQSLRRLSTEDLVRDPSSIVTEASPKLVDDIPSNNPAYEEPNLANSHPLSDQKGDDDDEEFFDTQQEFDEEPDLGSMEEKYRQFLDAYDAQEDSREVVSGMDFEPMPDRVFMDLRDSGCLSKVKHQLECGACYLFATLALYEYHFCTKFEKLVEFSVQYALDCGRNNGLRGCIGGETHAVGEYVKQFGLELETYYPYRNADDSCPYNIEEEYSSMGHILVRPESSAVHSVDCRQSDEGIERLLKDKGPLTIGLRVSTDFLSYGGGVDWLSDIQVDGDHMMVLVGYGREDGREYWLIRNSMGADWGEWGHYKLDKESNRDYFIQMDYLEADFGLNTNHNLKTINQVSAM